MLYIGDVTAVAYTPFGSYNLIISGSGGSILVHAQTDLGCRQVLQETVFSSQRVHGIHASKYDDAASSVWVAVWGGSQVEVLQLVGDISKQQLDLSVAVRCQLQCTQPTWVHDVCLVPWTPSHHNHHHQQQQQQEEAAGVGAQAGSAGLLVVAACLHNSLHCWAMVPPSVISTARPPQAAPPAAGESSLNPHATATSGAWHGHYAGTWQCDKQQMLYSMSLGVAAGVGKSVQPMLWVAAGGILREVCCWHLPLHELQEAAAMAAQMHTAHHASSSRSSTSGSAPALLSGAAQAGLDGLSPAQRQQQQQQQQQQEQGACRLHHVPVAAALQGHEGSVHQVRWVIPGQLLVTTSDDRSARVWRLQDTGGRYEVQLVVTCWGHAARVWDADMAGPLLATAGEDGTCRLWDVADGSCAAVIQSPSRHCRFWRCKLVAHSSQLLLVSGAADASLCLWSLGHYLPRRLLDGALAAMNGSLTPQPAHGVGRTSSTGSTCGSGRKTAGVLVGAAQAPSNRTLSASHTALAADKAGCGINTSHNQDRSSTQLVFTLRHQAAAVWATLSGPHAGALAAAGSEGGKGGAALAAPEVQGGARDERTNHSNSKANCSSRSSASDSKSEWVRALALVTPQLLLVATNKGLLHAVALPDPTAAADEGCQEVWTLLYEHPGGGPFTSVALLGHVHGLTAHAVTKSSTQQSVVCHEKQADAGPQAASGCCTVALGHIKGQACLFDLDLSRVCVHGRELPCEVHPHTAATGGRDVSCDRPGNHLRRQPQAPVCIWAAHEGAPVHGVFSSRVLGSSTLFTTSSTPVVRWWVAPAASSLSHTTATRASSRSGAPDAFQPPTAVSSQPLLLAEAASPYSAKVTAVDVTSSGCVLVLGDQAGNILTYSVPADIWQVACGDSLHSHPTPPRQPPQQQQQVSRRLSLLQRFKAVHGGTPVRCILPLTGAAPGAATAATASSPAAGDGFVTGGRDGCVARFAVYPSASASPAPSAAAAATETSGSKPDIASEDVNSEVLPQPQLQASTAGPAAAAAAPTHSQQVQQDIVERSAATSSSPSSSVVLSGVERLVGMTSLEEQLQVTVVTPHTSHSPTTATTNTVPAAAAAASPEMGYAATIQPSVPAGVGQWSCVARCGFKASCFVAWDDTHNQPLLSIDCGGARRPFSICCGPRGGPATCGAAQLGCLPPVPETSSAVHGTTSSDCTPGPTHACVQGAPTPVTAAAAAGPVTSSSRSRSSRNSTDSLQAGNPPVPGSPAPAAYMTASATADQVLAFAWVQDQDIHVVQQQLPAGPVLHPPASTTPGTDQVPLAASQTATCSVAGGGTARCTTLQQAHHAKEVNAVVVLASPPTEPAAAGAAAAGATGAQQQYAVISGSEDGTVRCILVAHEHSSGSSSSSRRRRSGAGGSGSSKAMPAADPAMCGAAPGDGDDVPAATVPPCIQQASMATSAAASEGGATRTTDGTHQRHQQMQVLSSMLLADHASGASIKCLDAHEWPHSSTSSRSGTRVDTWLVVAGGSKELLMVWRVGWATLLPQHGAPCTSSGSSSSSSDNDSHSSSSSATPGPQHALEFQQQLLATCSGAKGLRPKATAAGDVLLQADVRHLAVKVVSIRQLPPDGHSSTCLQPAVHSAAAGAVETGSKDGSGSSSSSALVHVVVSRSDARLVLMRLELPHGSWQQLADLQHHTHPVLSLAASWVTLGNSKYQGDHSSEPPLPPAGAHAASSRPRQVLLLASGSTQGELAVWDVSHAVGSCSSGGSADSSGGSSDRGAVVVAPALVLPGTHQSGINSMCFTASPEVLQPDIKQQQPQLPGIPDAHLGLVTGGDDQAVVATELHVVGLVQQKSLAGPRGAPAAASAASAKVVAGSRCCMPGAHFSAVRGVSSGDAASACVMTVGWDEWLNIWQLRRLPALECSQGSSSSSASCTGLAGSAGMTNQQWPLGTASQLQLVLRGRRRVLVTEPSALSSTVMHHGMPLQGHDGTGGGAASQPRACRVLPQLAAVVGGGTEVLPMSWAC